MVNKKKEEKTAAATTEPLAEPGHQRREQLKARQDALMAEIETISAQLESEGVDPAKLDKTKIPREVMAAMDFANAEVYVSNANDNYRYAWIYRDPASRYGNRAVRSMQVIGYEVVIGDMPEAKEHAHGPARERFVSDCILMRIRKENYEKWQLRDRLRRAQIENGVTAGFFDMAAKRGVRVFDQNTMPDHIRGYMESNAVSRRPTGKGLRTEVNIPSAQTLRVQAARQLAMDKLSAQIKAGTVEGLDVKDTTRR